MSSQIFLTILTVSLLFEACHSAGFLRFDFTSDSECLLHVDGPSYTGTIRLLAYETRSIELYSQGALTEMSLQLQLLHHFSGQPLSELSSQVFSLDNNDQWSSRVIDTDNVILSIRTLFHCENGYFGALCERKSRQVSDTSASVQPAQRLPSAAFSVNFKISNDTVIYLSLAFFVLLLVVANCCLFCCRTRKIHVYQDSTLPIETPKVFCIDEYSGYVQKSEETTFYMDAPSRFLSTTTFQSMV